MQASAHLTGSLGEPIEIRVLGSFDVRVGGTSVTPQGKCGLSLRALIALGGREVPQDRLAWELWPDAEGPSARRALDTTLHRLRRAIGVHEAILLRAGLGRAVVRAPALAREQRRPRASASLPNAIDPNPAWEPRCCNVR